MENEVLIAILSKLVEMRVASLPVALGPRGQRGRPGVAGRDGSDFIFADHEEEIKAWAKEFALRFEDLSAEQIGALRGADGRDGRDGKDFDLDEHDELFRQLASEYALRFEDLSAEEIGALRGPTGRDGADGHGFLFEENKDAVLDVLRAALDERRDSIRLKYSDLTASEIEELRGPRGRDGKDGRGFVFEDHSEYFETLRLKFDDLTNSEKAELTLKFSHLSADEREQLKLKFADLSDEDKIQLKGPRGARGQRGSAGPDGAEGKQGAQGARGPIGATGLCGLVGRQGSAGVDGDDGEDGVDAPYIVDIEVEQYKDYVVFVFVFSDGTKIESNKVDMPAPVNNYGGGGSRGGGRGVLSLDTRIDEVSPSVMYIGKATPGSATSDAVWQIQKLFVVGTQTIIDYADSDAKYDNVWDNRASLVYG